jgi:hypothetical protein
MKLLRCHPYLSLLSAYLASIYLWHHLLVWRAQWNHEALWRKPAGRTYPVSDRIVSYAEDWFTDHTAEDARDYEDTQVEEDEDRQAATEQQTPILCVAIDTFARHGPDYLPATVGSLLQPLTPIDRRQIHLIVRFKGDTDEDGKEQHASYDPLVRSFIVDEIVLGFRGQRRRPIDLDKANATSDAIWQSRYQRATALAAEKGRANAQGVVDYAHALWSCIETGTPYILILEDDIVAQPRWLDRIRSEIIPELQRWSAKGVPYTCTYLGHASQYMGWNNDDTPRIVTALVSLYLVAIVILRKTGLVTARSSNRGTSHPETASFVWRESKDNVDFASQLSSISSTRRSGIQFLLLLLLPLFLTPYVFLFLIQGKEAALPLPFGISTTNVACCSFAFLFSRESAEHVSRHLVSDGYADDRLPLPRDLAMQDVASKTGRKELIYKPALFQHVGVVSNRGFSDVHRGRNMGFELDVLD